ncbi:hypothetical protein SLEP1_g48115 [Rubroshorea leprosula]|uniref:Uncharacterized protein n=1 Tax=Rubroshorea leprosula TaxID=152421 RepID=A0AAV5LTJ2_9ROSI|nr:hypothetical protein SLEP1_g48115 [Rubroshorea leprosula]
MISSEPCALVGPVSRVHGVCHVPGFGFWGVTSTLVVRQAPEVMATIVTRM